MDLPYSAGYSTIYSYRAKAYSMVQCTVQMCRPGTGRALYRTVRSLNPIYAIVAAYNGNKALAVQVVAARRY